MKSVNRWTGLGNVGKDPEVKSTASGTVIASFSIALSERRKDSSGNWQDQVEWVNLVAFQKTAEIIRDYVHKGDRLYVEGRLSTRSWDSNGETRYRTEVIVNELVLLAGKGESARAPKREEEEPPPF